MRTAGRAALTQLTAATVHSPMTVMFSVSAAPRGSNASCAGTNIPMTTNAASTHGANASAAIVAGVESTGASPSTTRRINSTAAMAITNQAAASASPTSEEGIGAL